MKLLIALLFAGLLSPQSIIIAKKKNTSEPNTMGSTNVHSSTDSVGDYIIANPYTAPANGTNGTMHVYCVSQTGSPNNLVAGIYSDSAGAPGTLLSSSVVIACPVGSPAWVTGAITTSGLTSGTTYWLAINASSSALINTYYDSTAQELRYQSYSYTGTLPASFPSPSTTSRTYSIYVTY
jgi:hypothetical protein